MALAAGKSKCSNTAIADFALPIRAKFAIKQLAMITDDHSCAAACAILRWQSSTNSEGFHHLCRRRARVINEIALN
jgi:hypothetical protein